MLNYLKYTVDIYGQASKTIGLSPTEKPMWVKAVKTRVFNEAVIHHLVELCTEPNIKCSLVYARVKLDGKRIFEPYEFKVLSTYSFKEKSFELCKGCKYALSCLSDVTVTEEERIKENTACIGPLMSLTFSEGGYHLLTYDNNLKYLRLGRRHPAFVQESDNASYNVHRYCLKALGMQFKELKLEGDKIETIIRFMKEGHLEIRGALADALDLHNLSLGKNPDTIFSKKYSFKT